MKGIILVLAVCAVAAAIVPRDRRAVKAQTGHATAEKEKNICDKRTPCAWSVYKPPQKTIAITLSNTYCECGVGTVCQTHEDDPSVNAIIHFCKPTLG